VCHRIPRRDGYRRSVPGLGPVPRMYSRHQNVRRKRHYRRGDRPRHRRRVPLHHIYLPSSRIRSGSQRSSGRRSRLGNSADGAQSLLTQTVASSSSTGDQARVAMPGVAGRPARAGAPAERPRASGPGQGRQAGVLIADQAGPGPVLRVAGARRGTEAGHLTSPSIWYIIPFGEAR
jgi:hypothetical protein